MEEYPVDLATFTTETLAYLWRPNDTSLSDNMAKIVRTAESRMRTDLKLTQENITLDVDMTNDPWPLPADVDVVKSISFNGQGPGRYTTPHDFARGVVRPAGAPGWPLNTSETTPRSLLEYTIEGLNMRHRFSVSATTPQSARIIYTPVPEGLESGDDTLFNLYTDLYEKCVYQEALQFLLEEDRAVAMERRYLDRLDAARFDQSNRDLAGSPLKMQMPRQDVS